jgi:hypothetical protein
MNKKKILVFCTALILMVMIGGAVFAGSLRGVQWSITDTGITVYNGNDYPVRISLHNDDTGRLEYKHLDAYESNVFLGSYSEGVTRVVRD